MKKIMLLCLVIGQMSLQAGTPDFRNLTVDSLKDVAEEFSANFVPTTVSGASNMGRLWGFEAGLVATQTKVNGIKNISSDGFDELYNAALYGRVDAIYGLGAEVTMLPLELGSLKIKTYSMALKWTLTELFKAIPFNIKVKAFYNTADINYEDSSNGVDFDVNYKYSGQGINFTFSKKIILVEPYIGIGYIRGKSDIEANGSTNFFGTTVNQGVDNKGIKVDGTHFFAGVAINLIAVKVGAEYSRALGNDRISAKLAFGF